MRRRNRRGHRHSRGAGPARALFATKRHQDSGIDGARGGLATAAQRDLRDENVRRNRDRFRPSLALSPLNVVQSTKSTSRIGSSRIYERRPFSTSRNSTPMNSSPI